MKKNPNQILFFKALEELSINLNKTFESIKEIVNDIFAEIYHKRFDPDAELALNIDIDNKTVQLINKTVEVLADDDEIEESEKTFFIHLSEAQKINPQVKVGEMVERELDFAFFERDIVKKILQLLKQKVKEISKQQIFDSYNNMIGQSIEVIPTAIKNNEYIVFRLAEDANVKAFMPKQFMNPLIKIEKNVPVNVILQTVLPESRDAQIIVSLASTKFVEQILESEIPEIQDGLIEIVKIARIAGIRSKVVVRTSSKIIDPIAACIGVGGKRIMNIIHRLNGEKIDIIRYSEDTVEFIKNAMTPSAVVGVKRQEDNSFLIIVPDRHLSLAIGKKGTNVKLVYSIIETKIDIKSVSDAKEQRIDFPHNGNVSEEDLRRIERGEKVNFQNREAKRTNHFTFDDSFDNDIMSFNDDIMNNRFERDDESKEFDYDTTKLNRGGDASDSEADDFEADEIDGLNEIGNQDFGDADMFSDEELKAMEKQFGFDEELQNKNAKPVKNGKQKD